MASGSILKRSCCCEGRNPEGEVSRFGNRPLPRFGKSRATKGIAFLLIVNRRKRKKSPFLLDSIYECPRLRCLYTRLLFGEDHFSLSYFCECPNIPFLSEPTATKKVGPFIFEGHPHACTRPCSASTLAQINFPKATQTAAFDYHIRRPREGALFGEPAPCALSR